MTSVSTVSRGTTGRYESYDCGTQSYDTDSLENGAFDTSNAESSKPYEGTGVCKNRCPRDAPERVLAAARAPPRIMRSQPCSQA